MRILHLNDRLSERGGADWHLLGVLREQVSRGYDPRLAVGRDDGSATAPCPVELVPALARARRRPAVAALDALVERVEPGIIHVHNVMNPSALAWAADRGAVITVQDHRVFCPGRGKLTASGERCETAMAPTVCAGCFDDAAYFEHIGTLTTERLRSVRRMRRVTVLSAYMKRELAAVGVPAERIDVIPPFVHGLDPTAPASGQPCVLFAGRLVATKGIWDAVAAWERADIDLPLVFAGTGSERQALEEAGFEVTGWLPHHQLSGIYRRARALLLPSRWQEPFGIVGLEALALGVPVVAWDSGGVAEWAPEVSPWGDVDALARRLEWAVAEGAATSPSGFDVDPLMSELDACYARDV